MRDYVVVGGGISGLYAALLLSRAGQHVRVLERASRPGGLAGSETFRGVPCDLGSHRLHPDALACPLFREMAESERFLWRPRRGVLLLGDKRLPYPPTAVSVLRALGARRSVTVGMQFLGGRRRRAFAGWDLDRGLSSDDVDVGFERFVVDRVGAEAYALFYAPYAEKVWGLRPAELSQAVAKKRVSTSAPWRLLRRALGSVGGERFVYPARGTSSIVAFLERKLSERGVVVETSRAFASADVASGSPVLFAGHLGDIVPTRLEHRGVYLVYLALPSCAASEIETYYAPERRFWFGRVSELANYSPELRRAGETILCVEIPEGAWGAKVDFTEPSRLHELLAQLAVVRIVPPEARPIEVRQRFVPFVYPVYRRGWLAEWRATMDRVTNQGLLPFGRQALFLHCNLDHCAGIASDAVAHAMAGRSPQSWIPLAERALELRVRD